MRGSHGTRSGIGISVGGNTFTLVGSARDEEPFEIPLPLARWEIGGVWG